MVDNLLVNFSYTSCTSNFRVLLTHFQIISRFYVQMCGNRAADNRWHCEHIIGTYHNPQLLTKSDGWVTFEQDLLVTELVAGLTNLRWEFIGDPTGHNIRRDGRPELHLDNISIAYKSGVTKYLSFVSKYLSFVKVLISV